MEACEMVLVLVLLLTSRSNWKIMIHFKLSFKVVILKDCMSSESDSDLCAPPPSTARLQNPPFSESKVGLVYAGGSMFMRIEYLTRTRPIRGSSDEFPFRCSVWVGLI